MSRSRVRRMLWLFLTSALLAFVLIGCGGDGPVTVAPLPALLPVPPPFQPEANQVDLGTSGKGIALMTTEAGGITLNGEPVSGSATHAPANGNYIRTLSDYIWTATFAQDSTDVALGPAAEPQGSSSWSLAATRWMARP